MIMYLNELGLPKEWAKKKKLPVYVCRYFDAETATDEFLINSDKERVYLTIDNAVTAAIISLLKAGVDTDAMKNGLFAVVELEYNTSDLNSTPLCHDPIGNALDPEYDIETLSFNLTINGKNSSNMTISMMKVTDLTVDVLEGQEYQVRQISMRPVINTI